jgi:hypothetical protein
MRVGVFSISTAILQQPCGRNRQERSTSQQLNIVPTDLYRTEKYRNKSRRLKAGTQLAEGISYQSMMVLRKRNVVAFNSSASGVTSYAIPRSKLHLLL